MKKIVFKGRELTRTKVVNNIVRTFLLSDETDRFDWYQDANNFAVYLSKSYKVDLVKICGIIAALSPVKRWSENKRIAERFIATSGKETYHMKQFNNKAQLILDVAQSIEDVEAILKGRKITAFFRNILLPNDNSRVTIDRHALTIAINEVCTDELYSGMTVKQYEFFVECYKKASEKLNVSTLLVQSATWVYYRKNKKDWK